MSEGDREFLSIWKKKVTISRQTLFLANGDRDGCNLRKPTDGCDEGNMNRRGAGEV